MTGWEEEVRGGGRGDGAWIMVAFEGLVNEEAILGNFMICNRFLFERGVWERVLKNEARKTYDMSCDLHVPALGRFRP